MHMMIGSVDQVKQAERIKVRVNAEFDRIATALGTSAAKKTGQDQTDMQAVIAILEEKRSEIMGKGQADYFIHNWRGELSRIRELIAQDTRYRAINTRKAIRSK
jgi:hypothetical protein